MQKLASLVAAAVLAVTPLTQADDVGGFTLILPQVGLYDFDQDRGLDSESFWKAGGIGYQFNNRWTVELIYAEVESELESGGIDVDMQQYHLDALYTINPEDRFQGYFVVGAGEGEFEADQPLQVNGLLGTKSEETQINYGAGLRYAFTDRIALRGDVRGFTSLDESDTDAAVTLAMSWLFAETHRTGNDSDGDGVNDKNDKCPSTPAGVSVDATGCPLDSDNDGVPDHQDKCPNTPAGVEVNVQGCALDSDGDGVANHKDNCPDTAAGAKVDAEGCYVVISEDVKVKLNVEFDSNTAAARAEHSAEVKRVADFMREHPLTQVVIQGHTDSQGGAAYNQNLSERRAQTIAGLLVSEFGVNASRVRSEGHGESKPIADNTTKEGRQANRRVVAVVSAKVERRQ